MNLLPIIPDCKAIITVDEFSGKEVKVLTFLGKHEIFAGDDWWEVNPLFDFDKCGRIPIVRERHLMRIDGGKFKMSAFGDVIENVKSEIKQ